MRKYKLKENGPDLTTLTRRLAESPGEFLMEPGTKGAGADQVHTAAIVSDLLEALGGQPLDRDAVTSFSPVRGNQEATNRLKLIQVCCYLYYAPWFREKQQFADQVLSFLRYGLTDLAKILQAEVFIRDPERREELVRLCLASLGLRPNGESEGQAIDRLTTVDSLERKKLIEETRKAQEKARKLREAMARKAAREAASKMTRE